jgi:hypothetical protein
MNFDAKNVGSVLGDKKYEDLFGKIVREQHPLHTQRQTDNFPWFADWLVDYTDDTQ